MDPLEILPAEMWQLVFGNVVDVQDWLNLYRASPSFVTIVGEQRHHVLFPEIFRFAYNNYLNDELAFEEKLRLRHVCRQWRDLVDTYIDTEVDPDFSWECYGKYNFDECATIISFLEKFEGHPRNPVLGRRLSLVCEEGSDEPELSRKFDKLTLKVLSRFGRHLLKLKINGDTSGGRRRDARRLLAHLRNCVLQCPHLKELHVSTERVDDDEEHDDHDDHDDHEQDIHDTTESPENLLPNLERIGFHATNYDEHPWIAQQLMDELVRICGRGPLVKKADLSRLPTDLHTFPTLNNLVLNSSTKEPLNQLATFSWPLSHLCLRLFGRGGWIEERELFQRYIQSFKSSLSSLTISVGFGTCETSPGFQIDLPVLRRLTCYMRLPLWHLRNLRSLQELDVFLHVPPNKEVDDMKRELQAEIDTSKILDIRPELNLSIQLR